VTATLPLIRAIDPSIRLLIAGSNAPQEIRELAGVGIEVLGLVEDLRDLFDRARVFVCPLRYGAGAKGKVMSALSYGLPIVSTTIGIEGAGLVEGEHVLVADTPAAFAATCLQLYNDRLLWNRLSQAGQTLLEKDFSLEMGRRVFDTVISVANNRRMKIDDRTRIELDIDQPASH
jgi:glycosyltransferase involved in cell wall biosynthesis